MKVYIAHYDNGESWEDNARWYGDKVYINKSDCEAEIEALGYKIDYTTASEDYYRYGHWATAYANIKELKLIK